MLFDDPVDDREPHAGSFPSAFVEKKGSNALFRTSSSMPIPESEKGDEGVFSTAAVTVLLDEPVVDPDGGRRDDDLSAERHGVHGVCRQVDENPPHVGQVGVNDQIFVREAGFKFDLRSEKDARRIPLPG